MKPGGGSGHDVVAIVEHERVAVRVAEEIEGLDRAARAGVDGADDLGGRVDPDEGGAGPIIAAIKELKERADQGQKLAISVMTDNGNIFVG